VDEYEAKIGKKNKEKEGDEHSLFGSEELDGEAVARSIQDKISQIPELTRQKEVLFTLPPKLLSTSLPNILSPILFHLSCPFFSTKTP
jgi:hypothetical protein